MNLLIRGYDAYGDWISYNGLIRYLINYYDYIYITSNYIDFVSELFKDNKKIIIIREINVNSYYFFFLKYVNNIPQLFNFDNNFDELNLCIWDKNPQKKIKLSRNFFCNTNRIGKYLKIDCIDISGIPETYSNPDILKENSKEYENNSTAFYLANGIPKYIKFDNFYYERNKINEEKLYNKLNLIKNNYSVICEYGNNLIDRIYISNKEQIINIHNISKFFDILMILENATEVHLIENAVSLFIYHMQTRKLMKNITINLHIYSRKEPARIISNDIKSNIYLNMLLQPILPNWNIINK
jgi:hypothetical protein